MTGGYVYRGNAFPAMNGIYFFADFCRGALWGLAWSDGVWHTAKYWDENGMNISTFGEDQAGEVYVADFAKGELYRLVADPDGPAGERMRARKIAARPRAPAALTVSLGLTGYRRAPIARSAENS
ncbi:MAG: hypothetical protein ACRD44_08260 [Bryobacteraceae bacterium]